MYMYYSQSPKKHLDQNKLVKVIESRGLKNLKNIKIKWIFYVDSL
jgi:hypothetical protein